MTAASIGIAPAHADWLRAESERFIVYSDGGEGKLREFVQELETFDRFLRLRMGLDVNEAPLRKLPIYLVASRRGLLQVSPDLAENVAGFYTATDEDIFGIALRDQTVNTLKHEYAHHFMKQNFAYPYPGWFVEGFAEYYATVEIGKSRILVGKYNENRAYALQAASWMPIAELLSKRPLQSARHRDTYYPLAWLLTHWFLGDTERQKTLDVYLRDVGAGGDPVEAMERATGLDPIELRLTLRRYMNGRIPYQGLTVTFPPQAMTVTRLPPSADDLLLLNQRLKIGVPAEQRAATAEEVRRAAARHPDDPLALLALGHAELHFGDPAAAEAPLQRLLALQPNNVEALQYLARARMKAAQDAENLEDSDRLNTEARGLLVRAYRADDANYATLLLVAENRNGGEGYPNDNDVAVLEQAFALAPQLGEARINLAQVLMFRDRNEEAVTVLEPLVNDPHRPSPGARALLLRAKGVSEVEADAQEAETLRRGEAEGEATED
ncbi:tetratricopeptide repeat protein [Brevundimonas sp. NPDC090276]|uniref:tetratricopeptide repeat protein n=1 Tax=Brevundimonas sp. NPDC090276 TaxID=3363956 RepID=UPI00383A3A32